MKTVFCIGVYDMLHLGHVKFFERAKALGDKLIVGIVEDEAIKKQKGDNRPIIPFKDRIEIVSAIRYVDGVISCPDFNAYDPIRFLNMTDEDITIFAKGEDQHHIYDEGLIKLGVTTEILHRTPDISTTKLIEKLNETT